MAVKTKKVQIMDDVTGKTVTATASLSSDRAVNFGAMAELQDIQNAAADKASYKYSNVIGSGEGLVSTSSKFAVGTGDFSFLTTFKFDNSASNGDYEGLFTLNNNAGGLIRVYRSTENPTVLTINDNGTLTITDINLTSTEWQTLVIIRTAGLIKFYINSVFVKQVTSYAEDFTGTCDLGVCSWSAPAGHSTHLKGSVNRAIFFNYAISSQKIQRYSDGAKLDYEDIGGSMSDLISGKSWANINLDTFTFSGNDITTAIATTNAKYARLGFGGGWPVTAGKTYRVYYTGLVINGGVPKFALMNAGDSAFISNSVSPAAGSGYMDFVTTASDAGAIMRIGDGSSTFNISNMTFVNMTQLGAVLDLEPEGIVAGITPVWIDSSGNGLNGAVTGAVPTNSGKEIITFTSRTVTTTGAGSWKGSASVLAALPVGQWEIVMKVDFPASTATATNCRATIATNSSDDGTGSTGVVLAATNPASTLTNGALSIGSNPYTATTITNIYPKAYTEVGTGVFVIGGYAKRIA